MKQKRCLGFISWAMKAACTTLVNSRILTLWKRQKMNWIRLFLFAAQEGEEWKSEEWCTCVRQVPDKSLRQADRQKGGKKEGNQKELISLRLDNASLIYTSPIKASGWSSRAALLFYKTHLCALLLTWKGRWLREAGRVEFRAVNLRRWARITLAAVQGALTWDLSMSWQ